MSVRRSVSFSPMIERVIFNDDDSYDVKKETLKEESAKSSAIRKALSAEDKKFIRDEIKSLEDRQIELVDVIRQIENDAERGECFLEMNELKVAIDAFKEKL
ncbi:MAG: hypothetical protein K1060chlam4_00941 [Candidatus Anoxychlamydiales bacterium]|nr:hypothetical protein [Candidatus Anoxychlamydiales bacterium]